MAKVQTRRSISFNVEIHARALAAAEALGISLSKYAEQALDDFMAAQAAPPKPRAHIALEDRVGVLFPPPAIESEGVPDPLAPGRLTFAQVVEMDADATRSDAVRVEYDEASDDPW